MKLFDNYGRLIKDLRLSVTPRCNLHCLYCHPLGWEQSEPPGAVTVEDVRNFLTAMRLLGLEAVRFTGGEPLVRKELSQMIEAAHEVGIPDIAITTNGMLFKRKAKELVAAGLGRINLSMDAVTPEVFRTMTRGGDVKRVWEAIETAWELNLHPVKINAVMIRGMNEAEVIPLASLSLDKPLHVRFLEYMHLDNSNPELYRSRFVAGAETRAKIEAHFGPLRKLATDPSAPAKVYQIPGAVGTVGFINPVTEPFCASCSRLRLTSDKKLRPCLLTDLELDIAWAFEAENPVEALVDAILLATDRKPAFGNTLPKLRERVMVGIGG
ncbi:MULTISPECIES: GTP 3',8-cyclase MoaA [unclassified Meiothermus]|uniref:GTP 3',8-cyclase MoaA n=1 Tax=unclassified Meiothermus TaxID=370471 RepID=UPI000D7CC623|nr:MULTISPECIES: GTP 3',8-cyclase MoaA [unclassified Meiothermus]PZA08162.1 GTP 3',8-cyclase MoaA [Meiothermus sp. Pnk-1]RYM32287.1 GTP 3',8-cyclase MoaA [Meiothermus sp. PNK-Is4]